MSKIINTFYDQANLQGQLEALLILQIELQAKQADLEKRLAALKKAAKK